MRLVALLTIAIALPVFAAPAAAKKNGDGCQDRACHKRVAVKKKWAKAAPGCTTRACAQRVCRSASCRARVRASKWERAYAAIPAGGKAWLASTAACESHGNPRAHGNGGMFHGKYQFMLDTAYAAGFKTDPHLVSEREQDVRAYRWMLKAGRSQWPVCGR